MKNLSRLRRAYRRFYRWATRRLYHEWAFAYEAVAWLVSLGHWDGWRKQVLDYIVGARVLEIGFGTGRLMAAQVERGYDVVGVEPSRAMQRVAARRLGPNAVRVPRVRAVAQALPFVDGAFDTALSTFPTDYAVDPTCLLEIRRVLRTRVSERYQGRLVLTGVGFRARHAWVRALLALVFGGSDGDPLEEFRRFAEGLGFDASVVDDDQEDVRVPVLVLAKGPMDCARAGAARSDEPDLVSGRAG